jgi:hypothetical protein
MLESLQFLFRSGLRQEHPVDATLVAHSSIDVATNGTTAVNVFGPKGAPFKGTIKEVYSNALDTTAGNISLKINSNTVVTIAKGATAGVLVGGGALSTASFNPGDVVTLVSSSAGNSRVLLVFSNDLI